MARPYGDVRDFQGPGRGSHPGAVPGARRRRSGRSLGPRRPCEGRLRIPERTLSFWRQELERPDLTWGAFGENLTTEGLAERKLRIGTHLRVGSALLEVTQPRLPCYKLGIRFGRADMVRRFLASGRSGFYLAVLEEGAVASGDPIKRISEPREAPTVFEVVDEVRAEEPGG